MITQQEFVKQNDRAIARAKKTGKFTRAFPGQYYLYAGNKLYYVSKRTFMKHTTAWQTEWTWQVECSTPDDYYNTLAEAKSALYSYLEDKGVVHSLTSLQQ